jgi:hypothetical protein
MEDAAVFISYSREDLKAAVAIEKALIAKGLSPWRDQESIYAGAQWPKAIGEAISDNGFILLLWSKHSADSHFVEFEWTTAIALRKTIIPCLLDQTPLPPSLISFNGIPLQDTENTVSKLLATIQKTKSEADPKQKSKVLAQLQGIQSGDSKSMARAGTLLMTKQSVEGEEKSAIAEAPPDEMVLEGLPIGQRYEVI